MLRGPSRGLLELAGTVVREAYFGAFNMGSIYATLQPCCKDAKLYYVSHASFANLPYLRTQS